MQHRNDPKGIQVLLAGWRCKVVGPRACAPLSLGRMVCWRPLPTGSRRRPALHTAARLTPSWEEPRAARIPRIQPVRWRKL
ncbi:unnamed protein product, partial [Gulo gulo]